MRTENEIRNFLTEYESLLERDDYTMFIPKNLTDRIDNAGFNESITIFADNIRIMNKHSMLCGIVDALRYVLGDESDTVGKDIPETEIYYTGGGIFCAITKLADGTWFSGATNEWGTVYKTHAAAESGYAEDDDDFVRFVTDRNEQIEIWRRIYEYGIKHNEYASECNVWMKTLEADLEEYICP